MTEEQPTRTPTYLGRGESDTPTPVQGNYWVKFDAYAALRAELEQVRRKRDAELKELDGLRSGARTGLLKFMMAGDVGCFADRMNNLLQAKNWDELRNCVRDFFNNARDRTERGYEEVTREYNRAEAAEQSRKRMREALERAFAGMKAVKSLVAFYTKREMNAPANNQEAVRDARENEAAFDEGLEEARKALEGES